MIKVLSILKNFDLKPYHLYRFLSFLIILLHLLKRSKLLSSLSQAELYRLLILVLLYLTNHNFPCFNLFFLKLYQIIYQPNLNLFSYQVYQQTQVFLIPILLQMMVCKLVQFKQQPFRYPLYSLDQEHMQNEEVCMIRFLKHYQLVKVQNFINFQLSFLISIYPFLSNIICKLFQLLLLLMLFFHHMFIQFPHFKIRNKCIWSDLRPSLVTIDVTKGRRTRSKRQSEVSGSNT